MDDMHNKLNGDLDVKIDEMHHVMLSLRASLDSGSIRIEGSSSIAVSPSTTCSQHKQRSPSYQRGKRDQSISPSSIHAKTPLETPELSDSEFSAYFPADSSKADRLDSTYSRDSMLIPPEHRYRITDTPPQYERNRQISDTSSASASSPNKTSISHSGSSENSSHAHMSPPSVLSSSTTNFAPAVYAPSYASSHTSSHISSNLGIEGDGNLEPFKSQETQIYRPVKAAATTAENDNFRRSLFENAATLCEV